MTDAEVLGLTRAYINSRRKLGEFTPATTVRIRYTLRDFALSVGPHRPIAKVTRRHVERWLEDMEAADSTKKTRLGSVRAFLRWCVEHRHMNRNPADGVRGPKPAKSLPRAIAAVDITPIFLACPDSRARLMVSLMVQEGLRACEVARAQRDGIDMSAMLLTVNGKGSKERIVPLSDETTESLFQYLADEPGAGGPLIRSHNDPRCGIQAEYVSKLVAQWMAEAGVKRAPHDGRSGHALRHSCATHMADNGVDIRDISEVLGHATLVSTEIYLRRLRATGPLRKAIAGRAYQPTKAPAPHIDALDVA